MLPEMVLPGILQGEYAEELPFQFSNELCVFDNIMLLVSANMYAIYVLFGDRDCITDKENGLRGSTSYVVITGTDIPVREI